jgi:hypothetical protein
VGTWIATGLYLVPVLVLVFWPSRQEKGAFEIALAVPTAVAIDLLSIYLAARVMSVAWATVLSRPIWVAAFAVEGRRFQGRDAFAELHQTMVPAGGSLRVLCGSDGTPSDPACAYAVRNRPYFHW